MTYQCPYASGAIDVSDENIHWQQGISYGQSKCKYLFFVYSIFVVKKYYAFAPALFCTKF